MEDFEDAEDEESEDALSLSLLSLELGVELLGRAVTFVTGAGAEEGEILSQTFQ